MLKKKRFWIGTIVSVAFLAFLFRQVDLGELKDSLQEANYWFLGPAIGVYFVAFGFRALRWRFLLHHLKPMGFGPLFRVLSIGYMANNILPMRLGDIARSYILGEREQVSKASVLGNIAVERTLDGIVLVLFMAVAGVGVALSPLLTELGRWAAVLFGGAFVGLMIGVQFPAVMLGIADFFLRLLPAQPRTTLRHFVELVLDGFQVLRNPRFLSISLLLTLPVWLGEAAMYYIIAMGFNLEVTPAMIMMVTATSNLALSIPSSQGGIGPFEFFAAQTIILAGVSTESATAYALVLHFALLVPITIVGFAFLWAERVTLGEALRGGVPVESGKEVASGTEE